ncbi:MAG: hypothetical protein OXG44_10640 [Gammaproteobacteria bacterium]|nr:hypothetical protein [Gammaproteobacteria bacterium]
MREGELTRLARHARRAMAESASKIQEGLVPTSSHREAVQYLDQLHARLEESEGVSPEAAIEQAAALLGIDKRTADAMIQASDDLRISHQALWNLLTYTHSILGGGG